MCQVLFLKGFAFKKSLKKIHHHAAICTLKTAW